MSEGSSLINLGNLSKPATVLIEKIADAVGVLYQPTHIKRMAEAEVEAEKIRSRGNLEITEIEERAIIRLIHEEGKKQENIESITAQATARIGEDAKPADVENDWITHFFERCRNVSDAEMQSLWSRILAGEANNPGFYSKRTIDVISSLDKSDAHLFTNMCSFALKTHDAKPSILVLEHQASFYKARGINFQALNQLDHIGLIKFMDVGHYLFKELPKNVVFLYFDQLLTFTFQENTGNNLDVGQVMLTQAGKQLASICGSEKNTEFLDYMIEYYNKKGVKVEVMGGTVGF